MKKVFATTLSLFLFINFSCNNNTNRDWVQKSENPDFLHRSIKQVTDVVVHDIFSPPVAGRIYLYTCVAAYEAAIPEDSSYRSMAGQLKGLDRIAAPDENAEYSYTLASSQAVLTVGKALVFSEEQIGEFEQKILPEFQNTGMPEEVYERSIEFGNKIAKDIIEWAEKDNYKQTRSFPKYSVTNELFAWKPTPPAYMDGIEPHWNKIKTSVLDSASQFKPAPCTEFSINKGSQFYKEAMETYNVGNSLDDEQKEIAMFWDCNPFIMNVKGHVMFATKKISPAGHWINIIKVVCRQGQSSLSKSAEAYALAAIAMSEGFISCWDEKYRSKLIRPETYINQYIDEDWVPVLQTPPFPEYTSGHSVISNAAAVVLTSVFNDGFTFTDSTEVEFGMPIRRFKSFQHAADEASISRLYGGIHYRPAIVEGVNTGKSIGEYVISKLETKREVKDPAIADHGQN